MSLSLEALEIDLRTKFQEEVLRPGVGNQSAFLQRWAYLSSQVPRLHGAALARVNIPDVQCLLAEIAYGECGFGDRSKIHCKLLQQLIELSPHALLLNQTSNVRIETLFEETISRLCRMTQDEAIGFIVGLEAPAYDILQLLKTALVAVGVSEQAVEQSEYMVIHEAVEKEHQASGHCAMEIVLQNRCDFRQLTNGGHYAIQFLIDMVGNPATASVEKVPVVQVPVVLV